MIAKFTGNILSNGTYTNKQGEIVPFTDMYSETDGSTVRVFGLDTSAKKKFELHEVTVQIMNGNNGLFVRVPKEQH